jgi:hypothetical protein
MAQTAVGDLVVNLDVNSTKFTEQISYVKKVKQTGDAANDAALRMQQSFTRQESAARKAGISVGQYNAAMRMLPAQFTDIATAGWGAESVAYPSPAGRPGEGLLWRYSNLPCAAGHYLPGYGGRYSAVCRNRGIVLCMVCRFVNAV